MRAVTPSTIKKKNELKKKKQNSTLHLLFKLINKIHNSSFHSLNRVIDPNGEQYMKKTSNYSISPQTVSPENSSDTPEELSSKTVCSEMD